MWLLPSGLSRYRRTASTWKLFHGQEEKLKSRQGDLNCFLRAKCGFGIQAAHRGPSESFTEAGRLPLLSMSISSHGRHCWTTWICEASLLWYQSLTNPLGPQLWIFIYLFIFPRQGFSVQSWCPSWSIKQGPFQLGLHSEMKLSIAGGERNIH